MKTINDITNKQKSILLKYFLTDEVKKGNKIIIGITDEFEVYTFDTECNILIFTSVKDNKIILDSDLNFISELIIDNKIKRILVSSILYKVDNILDNSFKLFEGLEG